MVRIFPCSSVGKESACNAGDLGSIPGSGRSPGKGNGNSLQYSCLENPMDRGAWWAIVHTVTRVEHDLVTKERENEKDLDLVKHNETINPSPLRPYAGFPG